MDGDWQNPSMTSGVNSVRIPSVTSSLARACRCLAGAAPCQQKMASHAEIAGKA